MTDLRPLRDILAERKDLIEKYVPAATREQYARVVAELKATQTAGSALRAGDTMPGFVLNDSNGKPVSSAELLAKGRLIICFLRGRWCPFCVGQTEAMNLFMPQIQQAGASMIAISPQTEKQSFLMQDQHKLRFPLLSDPRNDIARQFGLVYRVPGYQQAIYKSVFVNLPFTNGDDSWELPVPATFVIERDGTVVYASVDEDYTQRPEPEEILRAIKSPQA